ncbi:MAG: ribonuclease HI [Methylocystaceae bacterium]
MTKLGSGSESKTNEKVIELYTDGACSGNPGPGGWGAILVYQGREKELYGAAVNTTNQRMEIQAVIEGLKAIKARDWEVRVYSDSAYVVNAFNQDWLSKWQANGWKNSKKEDVANRDLWQELISLSRQNHLVMCKVKGHAGHAYNERCDRLARQGSAEAQERV